MTKVILVDYIKKNSLICTLLLQFIFAELVSAYPNKKWNKNLGDCEWEDITRVCYVISSNNGSEVLATYESGLCGDCRYYGCGEEGKYACVGCQKFLQEDFQDSKFMQGTAH